MAASIFDQPLLEAKILATLLMLADKDDSVDFDGEGISKLWSLGDHKMEEYIFEISERGIISYDSVGDDGFKPIVVCSLTQKTRQELLNCLAKISGDNDLLDGRIKSLLGHDPDRLRSDIEKSEVHIEQARAQIKDNKILAPLAVQLDEIERHFRSIRRVAENYDDVYKNIIKPVQEEGRSGVRATVRWAMVGIIVSVVASVLTSNMEVIIRLLSK